jgi:hypothetical protein
MFNVKVDGKENLMAMGRTVSRRNIREHKQFERQEIEGTVWYLKNRKAAG